MRAIAWISLLALLTHGARPDDVEQASSLIETAASGHMVRSGYSKKASRTNLAMETQGTGADLHVEQEAEQTGDGDGDEAATEQGIVIPMKGGKLGDGTADNSELAKAFMEAKAKYQEAARKVWGKDGTDMNDNFIQTQGDMWMKAVGRFKNEAEEMRKQAEKIYKAIVKSHTESAQKMMLTMKTEMSKLKKLNQYSNDMKDAIKVSNEGKGVKSHAEYYGKTVPGETEQPVNTAAATEQANKYAKSDNKADMDNPGTETGGEDHGE